MGSLQKWWQAFRYHFVPPSLMPAVLGTAVAFYQTGYVDIIAYLLVIIGVTVNHIALNMTDDYYDFLASVDRAKNRESNPYSGGSGTLTGGSISPSAMRNVFLFGYIVTVIIGVILTAWKGWGVMAFGLFGLACSFFYTAPPIKYGYHGLGEISQMVNFSLTIGLGAYYVQTGTVSLLAAFALLPLGFVMFSMIIINEIPDIKEDRFGKKNNLVVTFGTKKGTTFFTVGLGLALLFLFIIPLLDTKAIIVLFALALFPMGIMAVRGLAKNGHDSKRLSPYNLLTIQIHNLLGMILVGTFLFLAVSSNPEATLILICSFFVLYLPAGVTVFKPLFARIISKGN
ncbi:MAG TPA: prenyltransferase [Euryarchaeota archaeon]|nr:prenyltransferase [Euryarchaeota archaeon]